VDRDTRTPRAVVIGSGIGGSAATLLLAHAGVRTTLVEKNHRLGGSCAGYTKRGFQIDIGTHMFTRGHKGPLGQVLRRVGHPSAVRFVRTRDIAEVRAAAWEPEPGRPDVLRLAVPADLARMPAFLWQVIRTLELTPLQALRTVRLFSHVLALTDDEVAAWDHRTLEEFLVPFGCDAKTLALFGLLLGLYFILPFWEVSAGEALYAFRRMVRDNMLSYPIGGSRAIPTTYCQLAEHFGAEVRTGVGVRRILVRDGHVQGVELDEGTILPATLVVSTSSVKTTVRHLVGPSHFPAEYVDRALAIVGSQIAVQAKIALRRPRVSAGALVGGVGEINVAHMSVEQMKAGFAQFARGELPTVIPFYCPVPTNFDPTLAPPGCQLLTACALAPTTDIPLADPASAWEEALLRALRRVLPDLDRDILFVDRFSVRFIEHWIGKEFGPAVSTGQTPDQVGARRPPVHTPIRGLYLAGCGAGGRGVGTELAAASAMECVDRILLDLGVQQPERPRLTARQRLQLEALEQALRPVAWASRPTGAADRRSVFSRTGS
jgi:phytoene dehydrogenase-like protein